MAGTLLLGAGVGGALLVGEEDASAQARTTVQQTSPAPGTETTTTAATGGQSSGSNFNDVFWKIFVLALLVALVWAIPFLVDIGLSYHFQHKRLNTLTPSFKNLIEEAARGGDALTVQELQELLRALDIAHRSPRGITGLPEHSSRSRCSQRSPPFSSRSSH
jgi:hypothetical protein